MSINGLLRVHLPGLFRKLDFINIKAVTAYTYFKGGEKIAKIYGVAFGLIFGDGHSCYGNFIYF